LFRIRHRFVSPGPNYRGQHGWPPGSHPILAQDAIECVPGRVIRRDRYFDHQPDFKDLITFF